MKFYIFESSLSFPSANNKYSRTAFTFINFVVISGRHTVPVDLILLSYLV